MYAMMFLIVNISDESKAIMAIAHHTARYIMKKLNLVIVLLVVSVALAACGTAPAATPAPSTAAQPLPAVVSASGKVVPEQWANLSFRTGGPIR
jgi:multidrug efflux pump subunit AcrA (membrane-fusion protein)